MKIAGLKWIDRATQPYNRGFPLVRSDLDQEDTRIMYNYLSTSLFPAVAAQESRPAMESRPVSASNGESSQQAAAGRSV